MEHFQSPGKLIITNMTGLEVIKRIDDKKIWIAAVFGLYDNRLYLYYLNFKSKIPKARRIKNRKKLLSLLI